MMAVGANEKFWETGGLSGLPKVFKHDLMNRYLPVFLIRTSSVGKRAAYFDGYAGRGKYDDRSLGSPGYMLEFAVRQLYSRSTTVSLYLCEKDPESYAALEELARRYRTRKVDVHTERDDATTYLRDALGRMRDVPAFLFLDPCGVGLRLPEELARVDALLDDPAFFAPFVPFFDPRMGRPSTPMETYLRSMLSQVLTPLRRRSGAVLVMVRRYRPSFIHRLWSRR